MIDILLSLLAILPFYQDSKNDSCIVEKLALLDDYALSVWCDTSTIMKKRTLVYSKRSLYGLMPVWKNEWILPEAGGDIGVGYSVSIDTAHTYILLSVEYSSVRPAEMHSFYLSQRNNNIFVDSISYISFKTQWEPAYQAFISRSKMGINLMDFFPLKHSSSGYNFSNSQFTREYRTELH